MKTIVAIATPLGQGGIGIVRLSGEDALRIANGIFAVCHIAKNATTAIKGADALAASPNKLIYGTVSCDGFSDKGYAVFFKAPHSFTGEDVVEFQLHGGVRILDGVVRACVKLGAVPAERGEFTKRAFLNGKITLADAEGVVDMINAESAAAVRAAFRLMDGEFGAEIKTIEGDLLSLISGLEASLDYPDEMEDEVLPALPLELDKAIKMVENYVGTAEAGRVAKHGVNVALVGRVNVGKSSLMNAILKRDRAIVTELEGTTRDLVTESIEYKGVRLNLTDTAGIRESADKVEQIGVERAKNELKNADVVLYVADATQNTRDEELLKLLNDVKYITVLNKADKLGEAYGKFKNAFYVSAKLNKGIAELLDEVRNTFSSEALENGEVVASERHLSALNRALTALKNARTNSDGNSIDCTLIDLREAVNALGEITGTTASDEIIERIFSKFCVGK